jgi:hypothetical protein
MTVRLSTTVSNIEKAVSNEENVQTILRFFEFMKKIGTSESYQNNNLKAIIAYSKFLGSSVPFYEIKTKSQITLFLDTKIKTIEDDPDKRWITTWNDYLGELSTFLDGCTIMTTIDLTTSNFQTGKLLR